MINLTDRVKHKATHSKEKSDEHGEVFETKEIWKFIPELKYYEVSNFGKVRSLHKNKRSNNIITLVFVKGYFHARLNIDKKRKHFTIHRLVAQAFVDNPNNQKYVDHIDGDKTNNFFTNLRWVTSRQNNQNRKCHRENISTSKFKGVSFDKSCNKWDASIYFKPKQKRIGRFNTELEAATAYDEVLIKNGLKPVNFPNE